MPSEKIAFCMYLNPGAAEEYKRRHDAIWPELVTLIRQAGIYDYSIYLDEKTHVLFATQHRQEGHCVANLRDHPVMRRWWSYMSDLMQSNADGSPVVAILPCMFHLD